MLQDQQGTSKRKDCGVRWLDGQVGGAGQGSGAPAASPAGVQPETGGMPHAPAFLQVFTCPNSSFTDLAEIVSRIEPAKVAAVDGELDLGKVGQERGGRASTMLDPHSCP